MGKYKTMLQESFRTFDNPLDEETSKLLLSYLKFYGYTPKLGVIKYDDNTYKINFISSHNIASLRMGKDLATLVEYDGLIEVVPLSRIDFIKKEKLEYLGDYNNRCIVFTFNKFSMCFYYGPNHYIGMKKDDYYNNRIKNVLPDYGRDLSEYQTLMMRLVASGDYANEIRASKFSPKAYYGRQY